MLDKARELALHVKLQPEICYLCQHIADAKRKSEIAEIGLGQLAGRDPQQSILNARPARSDPSFHSAPRRPIVRAKLRITVRYNCTTGVTQQKALFPLSMSRSAPIIEPITIRIVSYSIGYSMPRERKELTRLKVPALPKIHNKQAIARNKALNASEGLAYDCTLAARILEGNMGALDRLLERHLARINRFLQHRLGTGHARLVRDVTTATFDDALRHLKPYAQRTATTPMEYWLIGLAERNLGKIQQAKGKARPTATAPPTTVRSTPKREHDTAESDLAIVRRAMAGLSRQDVRSRSR